MGFGLGRTLRTMKSIGRLSRAPTPSPILHLESPTPHLLVSNQAPTEVEAQSIRQAIRQAESQLSEFDFKGHDVRASDPGLTSKQRDAYLEFIRAHEQILSSCRRLPVEILQEIFHFILPQDPQTNLPTRYWRASSQVCMPWREAALTIAELWSYVPRLRLSDKRTHEPLFLASLTRFLSLSGNGPLRLRIDAPFREYRSGSHPALDELMRHAERWEYLQMDSTFSTYKLCFTKLGLQGAFKSLRYLELHIWRYDSTEGPFIAFQDAPKLEEVSIRGTFPLGMELPWGQLKVYKEGVQNHTGLRMVLNNAKNLEWLEVTRQTECILSGPVPMPRLKTLYMRYDNVIPPDNVIALLVLPALEDLQIVEAPGELLPYLTHNLFGSLEQLRSEYLYVATPPTDPQVQLRLRRLAFQTQAITPGDLIALLRLAPLLEELDMPHPPSYDLQALIHSPRVTSGAPLVPNLRRLYIHTDGDWGDEDTYWKIARSRCERQLRTSDEQGDYEEVHVATLETFHIICERPELCGTQQATLEGWFDPASDSDPTFQSLSLAKSVLLYQLPELVNLAPRSKRGTFTGTAGFSKRLHTAVVTVEKIPPITNAHHLYRSGIHLVLRRMAQLPDGHIPDDGEYQFRERAGRLVDRWMPLFEEDIKDNLRWVRMGEHSLAYIPSQHELRKQPDAVEELVFGMENDRHNFNIFWHRYM